YPADDAVALSFRFGSGALGQGIWQFNTAERRDKIEILGSEGKISTSTFGPDPLLIQDSHGNDTRLEFPTPSPVQLPLIQSVVDELLGRRPHRLGDGSGE